ncbi:MAG: hypothetical protein ACO1OT_17400 [Heyndrickxia sp.]|jgi:ABC-type oligopeptide transport system ATPase subunit
MKQFDSDLIREFLKDIETIKSILNKYEGLFSIDKEERIVTLRDIMTEQERRDVDELKMDLLDAMSDRERAEIQSDIYKIFKQAKSRYYSKFNKE